MDIWLMIWCGVILLSLLVEVCTFGLVSIWFAIGATVAAAMAAFELPEWSQIAAFVAVSLLLLLLLYRKMSRRRTVKTNSESLIGGRYVVTETINNLLGSGRVQVGGLSWSAKSTDEEKVIPEGTVVVVRSISGVHLFCEAEETTSV